MEMVRIVHPEAGEADVPESAVQAWRSSGWERADEAETGDAEADEQGQTAESKADQQDKPSGSRRRSTKESE